MASKMAAIQERFYCFILFFIHKYIFEIFGSEMCFICNECLFLINNIYNFEIFSTVDSRMASKMAAKMENSIYW